MGVMKERLNAQVDPTGRNATKEQRGVNTGMLFKARHPRQDPRRGVEKEKEMIGVMKERLNGCSQDGVGRNATKEQWSVKMGMLFARTEPGRSAG